MNCLGVQKQATLEKRAFFAMFMLKEHNRQMTGKLAKLHI